MWVGRREQPVQVELVGLAAQLRASHLAAVLVLARRP